MARRGEKLVEVAIDQRVLCAGVSVAGMTMSTKSMTVSF